jgi:hypothetical protein
MGYFILHAGVSLLADPPSYPAKAGVQYAVTPMMNANFAKYWIARSSRATTAEGGVTAEGEP